MSTFKRILELVQARLPSEASLRGIHPKKSKRDFLRSISKKKCEKIKLIAELKRKSPSRGFINESMTVENAWELYSPYASALSVLTEKDFFGGSLDDLKEMSDLSKIPILRKDFIIHPRQVKEARAYGADAYLLIVAALDLNQLKELLEIGSEYNMSALVEVHNESELETALEVDTSILGINNRDLHHLGTDVETTHRLFEYIPDQLRESLVIVSESGLHTRKDIDGLPKGIDAVLVGTSLMGATKPHQKIKELFS